MPDENPNPTPPVDPPAAPAPVTQEYVDSLKELIETQSGQISQLNEAVEGLKPKPEPPKPEDDPEFKQPENWKEVRSEFKQTAAEITRAELKKIEDEKQRIKDEEARKNEDLNKELDAALSTATEQGFIAKVTDPNDPNDAGLRDQKEVFSVAAKLGTANLVDVAKQVKAMHDRGLMYDYQKDDFVPMPGSTVNRGFSNTPPPQAPVASSGNKTPGGQSTKPDYHTLHTRSLDELIRSYGK